MKEETDQREQCFELSVRVEMATSRCSPKETISIDGMHQESAHNEWNITLGPVVDTEPFLTVNETSGDVTPRDPSPWIQFIDKNWPLEN